MLVDIPIMMPVDVDAKLFSCRHRSVYHYWHQERYRYEYYNQRYCHCEDILSILDVKMEEAQEFVKSPWSPNEADRKVLIDIKLELF